MEREIAERSLKASDGRNFIKSGKSAPAEGLLMPLSLKGSRFEPPCKQRGTCEHFERQRRWYSWWLSLVVCRFASNQSLQVAQGW